MLDMSTADGLMNTYNLKIAQLTEELMVGNLSKEQILRINTELKGYLSAKSHINYRIGMATNVLNEEELYNLTIQKTLTDE